MRFVMFVLCALLLSCGPVRSVSVTGNVGSDGGTSWVATAGVIIQMAQAADPVMRAVADASTVLTPAQKTSVDAGLLDASNSLGVIQTALSAYVVVSDAPHACQVRVAIDQTIGARLQVITMLLDFGVPVPPETAVVVGALGTIADALLPACPTVANAALISESSRIRAVLARGGAH